MFIKRFLRDRSGLEFAEYALTTALIAAGIVTAIGLLSGTLDTAFDGLIDIIS